MRRLLFFIAVGALGTLLLLVQHSCRAHVAKVTAFPSTSPGTTQLAPAEPDPALPVERESLRDAANVVREFFILYPLRAVADTTPAERAGRLAELTTRSPGGLLAPRTIAVRHGTAPGPVSSLAIRVMAPTSIQFVVTVDPHKTTTLAKPARPIYAVTVVRQGTWKVASLEPADAGDSGARP